MTNPLPAPESAPTVWDAIPVDSPPPSVDPVPPPSIPPQSRLPDRQTEEAYLTFFSAAEDGPIEAVLSVVQTDVG